MRSPWPYLALILAVSCGGFLTTGSKLQTEKERIIASEAAQRLLQQEDQSLEIELEEKLNSLHSYYVITQRELHLFDDALKDQKLQDLYQGQHYLSLLAVRTQIDEIEKDLVELNLNLKTAKKRLLLEKKITAFKNKSHMHKLSLENVLHLMKFESDLEKKFADRMMVDQEYRALLKTRDFQIFEKNIEHLSHLMEMNLSDQQKNFAPSEGKAGSFSGQEFPEKVWALTFSNGPSEKITEDIMNKLIAKNLKATFFQNSLKSSEMKNAGKRLIAEGMELGTQSMTNKELSKVGMLTLEKEITLAVESMEKSLKMDVKFYRLPYGSGIEVPQVREMLAKNKLIHVFWNIDSLDWVPQSPDTIVKRTKELMKKTPRDAGVILFHDVHPRSAVAAGDIMDHLKLDARRVCSLGTIVKDMNQGQKTVCSQKSF